MLSVHKLVIGDGNWWKDILLYFSIFILAGPLYSWQVSEPSAKEMMLLSRIFPAG